VHLVSLIIKKFVTMHDHMNVKKSKILLPTFKYHLLRLACTSGFDEPLVELSPMLLYKIIEHTLSVNFKI
jgi:hypothetical protein